MQIQVCDGDEPEYFIRNVSIDLLEPLLIRYILGLPFTKEVTTVDGERRLYYSTAANSPRPIPAELTQEYYNDVAQEDKDKKVGTSHNSILCGYCDHISPNMAAATKHLVAHPGRASRFESFNLEFLKQLMQYASKGIQGNTFCQDCAAKMKSGKDALRLHRTVCPKRWEMLQGIFEFIKIFKQEFTKKILMALLYSAYDEEKAQEKIKDQQ